MSLTQLHLVLLVSAGVLLAAIVAVRVSSRTGLPSLLLYLGLGLALGTDGLGVEFDDAALAQALGYVALAVILAEGGLTTRWRTIRSAVPSAVVLSTVGVAVSVALVAGFTRLTLGVGWREALLLGAIVSSTDAAAVFSVLRRLPLSRRLVGTLEAESGFNDAPVVIMVAALAAADPAARDLTEMAGALVYELACGAGIGLAVGALGVYALRQAALPSSGLYPLAVLALVVGGYAAASSVHASGFLATYLTGLVLGNARLPHGPATRSFVEGLGWLAQIGLFILLGLLASPHTMAGAVLPALGIGTFLLLVARPLSVACSLLPFRIPLREQALVSWAGLRGAVPIVLATVPMVSGMELGRWLFDIVFVLVVVFTLVQGPTLPAVARWLRADSGLGVRDLGVESAPLGHLDAQLLEVQVPTGSRLAGVEIFELRLPKGAAITLVVRDGTSFVPAETTRLQEGDELLVVCAEQVQVEAEDRLRAVNQGGKLARWLGIG